MEEGNNAPHTMGNGQSQQNPVHHTRPFFYVQPPPPQLYYMYQWHMYTPYGQFGYPGSGLHFGRPYVSSIPYMQYPGYVIPHVPLHPVEYRRMFNPYMPPPAACDVRFCHNEGRGLRETACSEAQTETSDRVNDELLQGLGKLEVCEAVSSGKQLDSGVVSPDSDICFWEDRRKYAGQDEGHVPMGTEQPAVPPQLPSDSMEGVVCDMVSTQSGLKNVTQQQGWCVTSGVLPFDGSSVGEDATLAETPESAQICLLAKTGPSAEPGGCEQRLDMCSQTVCGANAQSERMAPQSTTEGCKDPAKQSADPIWPLSECLPSHHTTGWLDKAAVLLENGETSKAAPPADAADIGAAGEPALDFEDLPYRILRLPFHKVTPIGLLQEDNPLWCVDQLTTFIPPASYLSSINNAYYSYYPQTAQDRQSILSPSLDELSSRDEVFSTDLEDMDLIPGHVYMAGGERADGRCSPVEPPGELALGSSSEEECSVCSRNTCATCGTTLSKTKWSKLCSPGRCSEKGDTDEEVRDVCSGERDIPDALKVTVNMTKRSQPRGHQASRPKPKKGCCERPEDPAKKYKEQESRSFQSKPHLEGQWKEGTVASDQESWESCSIKGRPKTCKRYHSSHGQERSFRKRPSCKIFGHQRTRRNDPDNEGDFPLFHRGRGMATARQSLASGSRSQHAPEGPPDPPEGTHLAQASCPTHPENQPLPHLRPFFYVHPSQSYIPYQWPVPVPYNPYCGLPSFGYSMIMPPNPYGFTPNPYMESPGYILPHAQLHLADYRRMLNPQFPPTMAYHARRFRCQHVMVPREMVSSEVQTEPLQEMSNSQLSCSSASCSAETHSMGSDSGKGSGCTNTSSPQSSESSSHPGKADSLDVDADLISTPPQASATPKGAYMFQWDQVQMSAEGSSLDSKTVPSSECVAESVQDSSGLLAQCDDSISSSKGVIRLFSSSANENTTTGQGVECDAGKTEQQCLPSYPDILLVSGSPTSGTDLRLKAVHNGGCETSAEQIATNKVNELEKVDGEVAEHACTLKEACFKIVRLPLEMHYLEEVQKVESSVWSVEPLVPSVEWMVQHEFSEAEKVKTEAPEGLNLNQTPTSPLEGCPATPLSPYLPSASWLADFGNVYYYSKMPPSMQAHLSNFSSFSEPPVVREKPTHDLRGHSTGGRTKKCMHVKGMEGKDHVNLKNLLDQSLKNVSSTANKGERNCPRCQAKADISPGVNLKAPSRSHSVTHLSTGDPKSQTRISCRCCVGKVLGKKRNPNVSSQNRDEEMENSAPLAKPRQSGSKGKRSIDTGDLAPLRRHSEKCSVKCSKLQEKNCACKEHSGPPVDEGNWWRHADRVRDNEENVALGLALDKCGTPQRLCAVRRRQADASWRGTTVTMSDKESEIAARRRTPTKQKKQCAHSQDKLHLSKTTALTHKRSYT